MEHDPLGLAVEERGARVDGDDLGVDQGAVTLLGILLGRVPEEARADRLLHPCGGLAAAHHVQLVSVHDAKQLLSHVLQSEDFNTEQGDNTTCQWLWQKFVVP